MDRREFLRKVTLNVGGISLLGLAGCGKEGGLGLQGIAKSQSAPKTVTLYDTYAMSLYMDGSMGPKTGIMKVDYILDNQPIDLEFWHGHGGRNHRFTFTPEHYWDLKHQKKILVETDSVASHTHKLFVDPTDPRWRVPGGKSVTIFVPEVEG